MLSDPFVLADEATQTYWMTGTGGRFYSSRDLCQWDGPFDCLHPDSTSWTGPHPAVWAAELYRHGDRYYCFATFTNDSTICAQTPAGEPIPRRATDILTSAEAGGTYRPIPGAQPILPADRPTLDGTFFVDSDGTPYMVSCGEWLYNNDGTMEAIALRPDLSGAAGEPRVLFRASDSPWSRELIDGKTVPNRVTDGPWLFRTATGRLGMLWTSWVYDVYTMGVAYSTSGTIAGPWVQQAAPVTPPNHGHGMIFRTFDGRDILSLHSHTVAPDGRYIRRPVFYEVDLSGDTLTLGNRLYCK